MKSFHFVIVEAEKAYHNEKEVAKGISLVTNTNIESVAHMNRVATVKSAPEGTILEPGDMVICHHNIFREKRDTEGTRIRSEFFIDHGLYYVPPDMIFAYRRGDSEWKALAPYFFVKPIEKEVEKTESGIILDLAMEKYVTGEATVRYSNKQLEEEWDVHQGDVVGYGKNQEYEFEIDGETLYRVRMPKLLYKR
jgi:co-chaperonin GroES (HSP10)